MELDDGVQLADPAQDQYFLSSPQKLALLVEAAGIRPTDHVVEVGAGIGTVARVLPRGASLTLIELDKRFSLLLHKNVPDAVILHDDALDLLPTLPCDVLISNLPRVVTDKLLRLLSKLNFRTAVVATGANPDLSAVHEHFRSEVVTEIAGDDFRPPQPATSLLVRLNRRSDDADSA